ncbi:MAG: hypothetical protein J6I38_10315 [Prevotella sp.]|nr:hypothetical protein [Prevotella sp.]
MDYIIKDWEKKMSAFESSVEKDLKEIRKCKADIQQMRNEIQREKQGNYFVRDAQRIILSAPEIILGNVDPDGVLYDGAVSKIVLRGTDVDLEASGNGGRVETRAASIRQIAEDPGSDGHEHVVGVLSEVVSQARQIVIESDNATGAFSALPSSGGSGVCIHTDSQIEISATQTAESREKQLENRIKELETRKSQLKEQAADHKESFGDLIKEIEELMQKREELVKDDNAIRTKYNEMEEANAELELVTESLGEEARSYSAILAMLSETNRLLKCFKDEKSKIKKGDDFKKNATGCAVSILGERIGLASVDGEGNLRDTDGSGIAMTANRVSIAAIEADGKLKEKGQVRIQAKNVEVTTAGTADATYDKGELTKATYEAEGDFTLKSKNITIESVDYEVADKKRKEKQLTADSKIKLRAKTIEVSTESSANVEVDDEGKLTKANYKAEGDIIVRSKTLTVASTDNDLENDETKEKALTAGGTITIRAEKMDLAATDTEGKATGSVSINAKDVSLKSMDTDKESHDDKALAAGGTMLIVSETMNVGAKSKDMKSKKVETMSEEISVAADKTLEHSQGDGKASVKLADGKATVEASKTQIGCDTEVKGEVKAPKATIDKVQVNQSFKSPNITDGMG